MKNLMLSISLLLCFNAFAQDQYVYKGNGRVFDSKGVEVSPEQMRNLLADNTKALELYNAGRSKFTVGNNLLGFGIGLELGTVIGALASGKGLIYTPLILGGVLMLVAIPIKSGYSKKILNAVDLMNENPPKQLGFNIESTNIIVNQNGIGVAIRF